MARFDVTTFGESLLRLSVPVGRPLELSSRLDMNIAGSESNVLAVLAQLGHDCSWASSLPNNALGRLVANQFRLRGIDLSDVVWREKRPYRQLLRGNGRSAPYHPSDLRPREFLHNPNDPDTNRLGCLA